MFYRPRNLYTLKHLLAHGERGGYAVGGFCPRCTPVIRPIFWAGERTQSPIIVQVCQPELDLYAYSMAEFAARFWELFEQERVTVPVALHLDHTREIELVKEAIDYGFTSVMIDASAKPFSDNVALTREVVAYAHARGVSVEAELGRIGSADQVETDVDEELFTDPQEAALFVQQTGVDALAVSVGTAHGVYTVRQPRVDVERIRAIRALTPVHLVLHGGSGTPQEQIQAAIRIPEGGISKLNVATDLELALLGALGLAQRPANSEMERIPQEQLAPALRAVQAVVEDKIRNYLGSAGHAADF